ncbi:hypothetical protein CHAZLY21_72 [Vibrio phage Chazly21]|nr:hypothetical protein CHAZLY21_72 [Vibrio phage Chazly21]WBF69440.1 hypothetical protein IW18_69 [Vibrio phage IW18]
MDTDFTSFILYVTLAYPYSNCRSVSHSIPIRVLLPLGGGRVFLR